MIDNSYLRLALYFLIGILFFIAFKYNVVRELILLANITYIVLFFWFFIRYFYTKTVPASLLETVGIFELLFGRKGALRSLLFFGVIALIANLSIVKSYIGIWRT